MKLRIDKVLVENNLVSSRTEAKALIMKGVVYIGNKRIEKPSFLISEDEISKVIIKQRNEFVSRGGQKLKKALSYFKISPYGFICIDVGASSGGFTDCLLKHGALKVYTVDVGYGQLNYKLRYDDRVIVFERTNFRYFNRDNIGSQIDLIVCDVSFISIKLLVNKFKEFMDDCTYLIILIKPQFEAGKGKTYKGVVKDKKIHIQVLGEIKDYFFKNSLYLNDLTYSPIKGPKGNIEFLGLFSNKKNIKKKIDIDFVVNSAWEDLRNTG